MRIALFLKNRFGFFLAFVLSFSLMACATPTKPEVSPKLETSYSPYTPENTERLKTDVEGCRGTAQYYVGDQKGKFEVITFISDDAILSKPSISEETGSDSENRENRSADENKSNERSDAEEETLPTTSESKKIVSDSDNDEYPSDDEYISDKPVDVGEDLLKIGKIFVGVGVAALGAVAGAAVGNSFDGGEVLGGAIAGFGVSAGTDTMMDASDGKAVDGGAGSGRDFRLVLKIESSWESAAIEKAKSCLSDIGYSLLPSE